jgi:3,4-dihydroxy 2-butanone 4-phosphate synthase/GTP cyclohydrolase II
MKTFTKGQVGAAVAAGRERSGYQDFLSGPEEIIEEARQGRMFILVDDEDRENEGDLVIPAQWCTAETINFMARFGRGLICLAMDRPNVERLGLQLMARQNASRHETAFTVSIEAREGVTTGISAADRARTVQVAINPQSTPRDIASPGHVFPLVARDGGVLVRAGHTEAAVDIARLAGLSPAGVICEIMNDDGTMARLPDLVRFAQFHGLKVGTIADLINYRRRTETVIERALETELDSRFGGRFRMIVYVNKISYAEHIALVKGDITTPGPVLVRMHALNVLDDVLYEKGGGRGGDLQAAMSRIGAEGRGVVVLLREPQPTSLSSRVKAMLQGSEDDGPELRDYGVGAQILGDLGVREMVLLTNRNKTIVGLDGYGLHVVGRQPIAGPAVDGVAGDGTGTE